MTVPSPPRYPRLRPDAPVLRLGADVVQVGLDPGRAVVVRGAGATELLGLLDGRADRAELEAGAAAVGLAATEVETLLQALLRARLLDGDPAPAGARGRAVRVVGVGVLAQQLAGLLLSAGVDVLVADPRGRPLAPAPWADLAPGPVASPIRGRLHLLRHWTKPERPLPLTVLATGTVEPDRLLADHLLRGDEPHLVLRGAGPRVTVGPLVLPGRTPCLRCTDLARRDTDPGWPGLLARLTGLQLPPGPVLTAWAAAVGTAQVLAHLGDAVPESAGATLELAADDHVMRWRPWPRHAACGCTWPGTTDWGA